MTPLSPRQKEVASYVAGGLTSKAIAGEIGLSVDTVNKHIANAAAKIPGPTPPRHRLTCYFFSLSEES